MGVVYKLTPEISSFIVQCKKVNPALSCRQLVQVVKKEYDLNLSKSSINKVLRASHLSSPVGRRSFGEPQPRKVFKIPDERKKQLFSGRQPTTGTSRKNRKTKPPPSRPKQLPARPRLPARKEPVAEPGVGLIFIKAAEWEVMNDPLLGRIIKQHLNGFSGTDIAAVGEVLLLMFLMGMKEPQDIYQYSNKALWQLNGLPPDFDKDLVVDIFSRINGLPQMALELSLETPSIFTEISLVKIFLEHGKEIAVDPILTSFKDKNVQSGHSYSLQLAIQNIIDNFVENVQSAIFYSVGLQNTSDQNLQTFNQLSEIPFNNNLWSLWEGFEQNPGKKILRIAAYDREFNEIVSFSDIPEKPRYWIGGIWPWQVGFEDLASEGRVFDLRIKGREKPLFYKVLKNNSISKNTGLKSFFLYEHKENPPVTAIFSNIKTTHPEEIITAYINRWPHLEKGYFISELKANRFSDQNRASGLEQTEGELFDFFSRGLSSAEGDLSLRSLLAQLGELLAKYAWKHYFANFNQNIQLDDFKKLCVEIPGSIMEDDSVLNVSLDNKIQEYRPIFHAAAKVVNERQIRDFRQKRLIIKA